MYDDARRLAIGGEVFSPNGSRAPSGAMALGEVRIGGGARLKDVALNYALMPPSRVLTGPPRRALVERATDVAGIPGAFRPEPLVAEEMAQFYSDSLDRQRANHLLRRIKDDLLESAAQGFFFKGVLYGNRGTGKSTEINRLLDDSAIKEKFVVIRLDALTELNPQTFSVVDVLLLLLANLIERCVDKCREAGRAFHEADIMTADLQRALAPFFPELQGNEELTKITGGSGELGLLNLIKLGIRVEGQRRVDSVSARETLTGLSAVVEGQISIARERLPEYELLVIGENFDKEQIPQSLLQGTFVQYASVLRDLRLHLLFTLPVPFVYSFGEDLSFRRENRYPVYDIPVCSQEHKRDGAGCRALIELMQKRAELGNVFASDALELLLRASGGDLYRLFAITLSSGRLARYRYEDDPSSERRVLLTDVAAVVREQLGIFRNELGTAPNDPDDIPWDAKLQKLCDVYEGLPAANVPDKALYRLLRNRAVLFFNGVGRYGVHPMAVEVLREQLASDPQFRYRGGGLDFPA